MEEVTNMYNDNLVSVLISALQLLVCMIIAVLLGICYYRNVNVSEMKNIVSYKDKYM